MKEKLYTIPVNDAFSADCECPVCLMYKQLENTAIEFTMGPSYMEDDVRLETDKIGFCSHHVKLLYENQNRLGLALMLKTHMDKTIKDLEELTKKDDPETQGGGLFRKKTSQSMPVEDYIDTLTPSCYVCNRIEAMFSRYLITIFYLYQNDNNFKNQFQKSKGFCTNHYGALRRLAKKELSKNILSSFLSDLDSVYLASMKRVRDDLEWFTDKFDYRNADAPWKNAKDALPRSINKTNSILDLT